MALPGSLLLSEQVPFFPGVLAVGSEVKYMTSLVHSVRYTRDAIYMPLGLRNTLIIPYANVQNKAGGLKLAGEF